MNQIAYNPEMLKGRETPDVCLDKTSIQYELNNWWHMVVFDFRRKHVGLHISGNEALLEYKLAGMMTNKSLHFNQNI